MPPPKTLHITNFYHETSGGIRAFYQALVRYCNEIGREIRLVVPGEENRSETMGPCGRIFYVRAPRSMFFDRRYRLIYPFSPAARETFRILRAEQPDVLEISDKYTLPYLSGMLRKGFVKGIKRPREIATSHERMDDNVAAQLTRCGIGGVFARFYMRRIYFAQFDHHIANSRYTAAELVTASQGHTTPRGIWVCPMGLDVAQFRFREPLPRPGRRLLYAGRLAPEKNVALLIDVLERLRPEYSLIVAGEGPLKEWFQSEGQRRCPERIHMPGYLPDRKAYTRMFHEVDAFLHPNPREPFGITPLEAMASGVPVVAPNAGGVLDYANRDNCWLCDPNAESLANGVRSVFSDEDERIRKIRRARVTAEQHDWRIIARRYFGLIDSIYERGIQIEPPPLGAAARWRAA